MERDDTVERETSSVRPFERVQFSNEGQQTSPEVTDVRIMRRLARLGLF